MLLILSSLLILSGWSSGVVVPLTVFNEVSSNRQIRPPGTLLVPYLCGDKYGFADLHGILKIACEYDEVVFFDSTGLAPVRKAEKWAVIDETGRLVTGFDFLESPYISCGFYVFGESGIASDDETGKLSHLVLIMDHEFRKWAVYNRRDGYCSGLKYADWYEAFSDGPRSSCLRGGSIWHRPNKHFFQGGLLTACTSINSSVFLDSDGRETDGKNLNPTPRPMSVQHATKPGTPSPDAAAPTPEENRHVPLPPIRVENTGNKYRLTDAAGKVVLQHDFDNAGQTNVGGIAYACDSIGLVEKEIGCPPVRKMVTLYRCGLVNAEGNFVVPMEYESAYAWNDHFWETGRRNEKGQEVHAIFDSQGNLLFEKICNDIYPLNLKYLQVTENNERYLVDASGRVVINRRFKDIREVGSVHPDIFQSWEGENRNLINLKGEILASYPSREDYDSPVDYRLTPDRIIFNFGREHFIIDNQVNIICRSDFDAWYYLGLMEGVHLLKVTKQETTFYIDVDSGRIFKD